MILASPGQPWSDFVDFLGISAANVLQISKIPEQQIALTTPLTNKQGLTKNFTDNQFGQMIVYFSCLAKARKSEAPFLKIGSVELPE